MTSGRTSPSAAPIAGCSSGPDVRGDTPSAEPGARGSAAGVFAHEAKRAGGEEESVPKEDVCQAIRDVADEMGARPERLLMVDYQQRASDDDSLPTLSAVFAAYGSWKRARRAAAGTA